MWPFRRKHETRSREGGSDIAYEKNFLRIRSRDFFDPYSRSPNGRYAIAWSDADRDGSVGGFRFRGEGEYLLVEDEAIRVCGRLQRPNDGKVANNGTFVINDWEFGEGLKGTFYSFDCSGSLMLSKHFSANLYNNGLSPNGEIAVCQTLHSDNEDASLLTLFDLSQDSLDPCAVVARKLDSRAAMRATSRSARTHVLDKLAERPMAARAFDVNR